MSTEGSPVKSTKSQQFVGGGLVSAVLLIIMITSGCTSNKVSGSGASETEYKTYDSSEFGYSVEVPSNFTISGSSSDNPLGWIGPDKTANIQIFAQHTSNDGQDAASLLGQCKQQVTASGGVIDTVQQAGNSYTCSGEDANHNVYFERGFIEQEVQVVLVWSCPYSDKSRWSSVMQQVSASLKITR